MNATISSIRTVLLALFFAAFAAGCGRTVNLQTGLDDADANEIVAALDEAGIKAEKLRQKDGIAVVVEEKSMARANNILIANGLPKRRLSRLGDVFKKEGMISTPLEERARYIYALSQELEYTLSQIDGVIIARVHVVLPERVAPGEPVQPSSAAVMIKHRPELEADVLMPRVRRLVASSIPGLSDSTKDKVSVVFVPAAAQVDTLQWTNVGPFRVDIGSASSLGTMIGVGIALIVILASIIGGYFLLQIESIRERFDQQKERFSEMFQGRFGKKTE